MVFYIQRERDTHRERRERERSSTHMSYFSRTGSTRDAKRIEFRGFKIDNNRRDNRLRQIVCLAECFILSASSEI